MADYLTALWHHWVSLMSGIVGVLIGLGLRVGRRVSPTISSWSDVPDWVFIIIGVVALSYAGFLSWTDEHRKVTELQKKLSAPEMEGTIESVMYGSVGATGNDLLMTVAGLIRNPHGPPASLFDWSAVLVLGQTELRGTIVPAPIGTAHMGFDGTGSLLLRGDEFWPRVTTAPISAGGGAGGWIWFNFKGISPKDLDAGTAILTVSFREAVAGRVFELATPIHNAGGNPFNDMLSQPKRR